MTRLELKKPSAIFFGTPQFAAIILQDLLDSGNIEIKAVVTNADKPAGRGNKIKVSFVKEVALQHSLELLQPKNVGEARLRETLHYLSPDVLIVAAYGHILPKELLEVATKGSLNVHPSLLPLYRGPNPIAAAIDAGEKQTGVSIMLMDESMDTGPVFTQLKTTINSRETTSSLSDRLAKKSAQMLEEVVPLWIAGKIHPKAQDNSLATYTKLLTKKDGQIDWSESAEVIERHVRAFSPWPTAWAILPNKKRVKILSSKAHKPRSIPDKDIEEGAIQLYDGMPVVRTGDGVLTLIEIQIEGKQPMSGEDFLRGYNSLIGERLL